MILTATEIAKAAAQPAANRVTIPDYASVNLLVLAVTWDAMKAARRGDRQALQWLATEGAAWMDACGYDTNPVRTFISRQRGGRTTRRTRTAAARTA